MQVMDGKKELKAWAAIAEYMQSFEDTDKDGIANVPEYYNTTHERKSCRQQQKHHKSGKTSE